MTYRAGVGAALAQMLGVAPVNAEPTLFCDVVNCGAQLVVRSTRGGAPAWLRNKKAPKSWRRHEQPDGRPAQHTCPACTAALSKAGLILDAVGADPESLDDGPRRSDFEPEE